jgi:hypothetical protein
MGKRFTPCKKQAGGSLSSLCEEPLFNHGAHIAVEFGAGLGSTGIVSAPLQLVSAAPPSCNRAPAAH